MAVKFPIARHAVLSVAFVSLYIVLSRPEIIFIFTSGLGFSAWYPATGLSLALLLGISPWYGFLVCFSDLLTSALIYHLPLRLSGQGFSAVGVSLAYAAAAYLLRGRVHIDLALRRRRDVLRYVLVTMSAAVVATAVGVLSLVLDKSVPWNRFWSSALYWFIGDGIGLLGVAPFLLIHVFPVVRRWLGAASEIQPESSEPRTVLSDLGSMGEAASQIAATFAVLWIMFGPVFGAKQLFYLGYLPIIWMAMRQGVRRVVIGLLSLNFGIVLALHLFPVFPGTMDKIGLFMLVVSGVGLLVGSAVTERDRMALDLQEQSMYLNSLIENNPLAIAVQNQKGQIELVNRAFEKLFLFSQAELRGADLDALLSPEDEPLKSAQVTEQVFAGKALATIVKRRRKDGRLLDLEIHAVPLSVNSQVRRAFTIYRDISEQIKASDAERRHAESLSHLVQELQVRTTQMGSLSDMGDMLECCGTVKEAAAVVSQYVQKLFPHALSGRLSLFKASRNLVETAAAWGAADGAEIFFPVEACWALRRGKPHWSGPESSGINCPHLPPDSPASTLCVPMIGQEEMLGVLELQFASSPEASPEMGSESVQQARQQLASTVAGQVAFSLTSLRLRETLRDQSIRDPLTGLFNRRFMEESLNRELLRAARKRHSVSVLFADIDHFKQFNDSYGHDAGDAVLRAVAELFLRFFRSDDVCCRYGGEEFAIILPESSAEYAALRANALREEVKRLPLQNLNQTLGSITLSIGVAAFPEDASNLEELLRVADRFLYQAKAAGRDAVTAASPAQV